MHGLPATKEMESAQVVRADRRIGELLEEENGCYVNKRVEQCC